MPTSDAGGPAPATARSAPGWPDLDRLEGVADAVDRARAAIAEVRRLPANRRGWARTAAASAIRAARASAMLDGGSAVLDLAGAEPLSMREAGPQGAAGPSVGAPEATGPGVVTDPILAGAVRANAAVGELAAAWRRAPLQALARLHTLAAADLADADLLGRPRPAGDIGDRLAALARVVTSAPWSAPVTAAIVHGELLALRAFGSADGVVARAAARLTMVTSGLDPQALTVPEVGHLRAGAAYLRCAEGYISGGPEGLAGWIRHVCAAMEAGAREATSIARAAGA